MKSNIPWTNYCMRKYGGTLHKNITDLALRTIMNQKMAKVMDEFQRLRSVTAEAVWFDPKGGTA
jgi:hypothetical protein